MIDREADGSDSLEVRLNFIWGVFGGIIFRTSWTVSNCSIFSLMAGFYATAFDCRRDGFGTG